MRSMPVMSRCGTHLDECRCRITGPVAVPPAEMEARHREAVKRAERSGWPVRTLSEIRPSYLPVTRRGAA